MLEIVSVSLGGDCLGLRPRKLCLDACNLSPGRRNCGGVELAECVEQRAMSLGIEQPAVILLTMHFDGHCAGVAKNAGRHRCPAGESPACAGGLQSSAKDQGLAGLGGNALLLKQLVHGMRWRKVEP